MKSGLHSTTPRLRNLRSHGMAIGLVALAGFLTSLTQGNDAKTGEATAIGSIKQAYHGRAGWNDFPMFSARVRDSVNDR